MSFSLDKLVKNLTDEDFKYLVEEFGSENLGLLKQKGAYPYEYMNSFERFKEKKLPARKYFYSSTKDVKIGDDGKKSDGHISLKDYLMLLADVFEEFIGTYLKFYELDPCHYFSSPGLSWDAMLKMTGVKLENISDIDKYLFIEKGLRGGIFSIVKRYAKANKKYMNDYDSKKHHQNLPGYEKFVWLGNEYFPYDGFKWLKNVDEFDVTSIAEKSHTGYILEADLEYPNKLHVLHNDYPLTPEKLAVSSVVLSKYCKKIADK